MITPGFFGFYNAHRGLLAAQSALNTINHNISNANTEGYSRQRVDLTAYDPYAPPSKYQVNAGQIGQGPIVQAVTRMRDRFLDAQYRLENGVLGMDTQIKDVLQQIEGILAEPTEGGINGAMQKFFDAAQELSLHPESLAVRSDFVQQAMDLMTVFQQQALQLSDLRRTLVGDPLVAGSFQTSHMAIHVNRVNEILTAVQKLNANIVSVKSAGAAPNDLLDQRDQLLDELSELVDVRITEYDSGQIDVFVANQLMIKGARQVDSLEVVANPGPAPAPDDVPALLRTVNGGVVLNDGAGAELAGGRLKAIADMGGNPTGITSVRGVIGQLDALATEIVNQVNALQTGGRDLSGTLGPPPLFLNDPLQNPGKVQNLFHYRVNTVVINDPTLLAAAIDDPLAPGGFAGAGDGRNALDIAQLRDQVFGSLGGTFVDFFNGVTSNLGIDTRSYEDRTTAQSNLINSLENRRQSVSGVNVDEEMIDMLRYQRAFEATSRTIQVFDEIVQTILGMV